jgi:alpha-glucosidase (family GH31 glycosyl hydrolase)
MIVAPMTADEDIRKVYLPKGNWRDYWTKEVVNSGWFTVQTDNIPVFEKIEV